MKDRRYTCKIEVLLTEEQDEWLRRTSSRTGISMSEILRRMINYYGEPLTERLAQTIQEGSKN